MPVEVVVSVTAYFFERKAFEKLKHCIGFFSILFRAKKRFIAINYQQTKQASVTQLPSGEQIITKRDCQNFYCTRNGNIINGIFLKET